MSSARESREVFQAEVFSRCFQSKCFPNTLYTSVRAWIWRGGGNGLAGVSVCVCAEITGIGGCDRKHSRGG